MLTKEDLISILVELGDADPSLNINSYIRKIFVSKEPPIDALKFISEHRGVEAVNFYEVIRKSYNEKKSKLYKNIVKTVVDDNNMLTTLSSLLTQINLYASKIAVYKEKELFFREVRAKEIARVLSEYYETVDPSKGFRLLALIRSDLLVLEYVNGRRSLEA